MYHYQRSLVAALYLVAAMGIGTSLLSCYPGEATYKGTKDKETAMNGAKLDKEIIQVVREYVKKTRGWQEKEYTYRLFDIDNYDVRYIKKYLRRDPAEVLVIDIIHIDDTRRDVLEAGGGKSFRLYIDRKTLKVLAELRFQ